MADGQLELDRPTLLAWSGEVLDRLRGWAAALPTAQTPRLPGGYLSVDDLALPDVAPDPRLPPGPSLDGRAQRLATAAELEPIEIELLLLAALPEIDARFETVLGYLHNDMGRRRMSVGALLRLTGAAPDDPVARARLQPGAPLVEHGLLRVEDPVRPFPSRAVLATDRVVQWLLGGDRVEADLVGLQVPGPALTAGAEPVRDALRAGTRVVYLRDQPGSDARATARGAAESLGVDVFVVDLDWLPAEVDLAVLARRIVLEARLQGALLVVGPVDRLVDTDPGAVRTMTGSGWPVVLHGGRSWDPQWSRSVPLVVAAPVPPAHWSARLWRDALPGTDTTALPEDGRADVLSSLKLRGDQILAAAEAAAQLAGVAGRPVALPDLLAGARARNGAGLERLARRVEPRAGWDDLILPAEAHAGLRELVSRSTHRDLVFRTWQLTIRGHGQEGLAALFDGPSGTGKTLGAEVVAAALGVDLYVVDLSTVVDKYIGETEKKLDRIFTEAESVNGVLLFDEADALFGRRSEVKDSHDRYANVEVAYLLQRMESFAGTVILTTNLRQNVDDAFLRRLDAIVAFPLPDPPARLRLWQRFLAAVPLADDVDLAWCAQQLQLSGGEIRNIAVTSAFMAAQAEQPVDHPMIVRAVEREYRKLGRLIQTAEFAGYAHLLSVTRPRPR